MYVCMFQFAWLRKPSVNLVFVMEVRELQSLVDVSSSTQQWEIFYLVLKHRIYKQNHTHTQSRTENSIFQF